MVKMFLKDNMEIIRLGNDEKHIIWKKSFKEGMAKGFEMIEKRDMPVDTVLLSVELYRVLRVLFIGDFDPFTKKSLIVEGLLGVLWCADVRVDGHVPTDRVYFSGTGDDDVLYSRYIQFPEAVSKKCNHLSIVSYKEVNFSGKNMLFYGNCAICGKELEVQISIPGNKKVKIYE